MSDCANTFFFYTSMSFKIVSACISKLQHTVPPPSAFFSPSSIAGFVFSSFWEKKKSLPFSPWESSGSYSAWHILCNQNEVIKSLHIFSKLRMQHATVVAHSKSACVWIGWKHSCPCGLPLPTLPSNQFDGPMITSSTIETAWGDITPPAMMSTTFCCSEAHLIMLNTSSDHIF